MRTSSAGFLVVGLLLCSAAAADVADLDGELRLRADYYPDAPDGGLGSRVLARVGTRGSLLDAAARLEVSARHSRTSWDEGIMVELRDAHLTWAGDWGSLRLGHQQVAWGRADAFRLLDTVNPWLFPDALFDDLADARIPLWMANLELPLWGLDWQVLGGWDDRLDESDPGYPPIDPFGDGDARLDDPTGFVGLRVGAIVGDVSVSLHWLDQPDLRPLWLPVADGGTRLFDRRRRLLGLSADWPLGAVVARLEATTAQSTTLDARPQSVSQRITQGLIGLDWQTGNWLLSPQFYYEDRDPPDYGIGDRGRAFTSLLLRHRSMQDRLEVRGFVAYGLDNAESWWSLRIGYTVSDHLELRLHADRFDSVPDGLFGPFADLSRVGLEAVLRY